MKTKIKATVFALGGNTLLLFFGLFGGVFSLTAPFELVFSDAVFWVVCLSAVLVGLLHTLQRGRLRLVLALAVCAVVALAVWRQWDSVFLGAQVVFHKISLAFHQELPQILYYELPAALSEKALTAHASRFVCATTPLMGLWLGAWQLRGRAVWPAALAVGVLPGLSLFILRSPSALALGAALLYLALSTLCRKGYQRGASLGGRRVVTAAVPVAAAMALIAVIFPQSSYQRPAWVEDLRIRAKTAAQGWVLDGGSSGDQPGVYSFRRFGAPSFDGHTVLMVRSDLSGHVLLRGWSAAEYTRYGWQGLSEEALAALPSSETDSGPWSYPAHAALDSGEAGPSRTMHITEVDTAGEYYYTPYFPSSMYAGAVFHGDSYIARLAQHYYYAFDFLDPEEMPAGAQVGWDGGAYYGEPEYRDFVYQNYLDVPYALLSDEAVEVIRTAARYAREQDQASYSDLRGQRIHQAQAVADYLASFTRYDLSTPAQPLGQDFVSYFLTDSHHGYCAHYATAATLILREMGIPARFVTGYAADLPEGGQSVNVPDQNAHAWVELYVDGFGWQPADVTPAGAFGPGPEQTVPSQAPSAEPSAAPSASQAPASASPSPSAAPSAAPSASQGPVPVRTGSAAPAAVWWCLGGVLAVVAALFALWLRRQLRLRRWKRQCGQPDANAAVIWLYRYLETLEQRLGRAIPEEALALAQKAAFSQHTLTQAERQTMEGFVHQVHDAARSQPLGIRLRLRWVWCLI